MKSFGVTLAVLSTTTTLSLAAPYPQVDQQDERFADVNCADYQENPSYTVEEFIDFCEVDIGCPVGFDIDDGDAVWTLWEGSGRDISYRLGKVQRTTPLLIPYEVLT